MISTQEDALYVGVVGCDLPHVSSFARGIAIELESEVYDQRQYIGDESMSRWTTELHDRVKTQQAILRSHSGGVQIGLAYECYARACRLIESGDWSNDEGTAFFAMYRLLMKEIKPPTFIIYLDTDRNDQAPFYDDWISKMSRSIGVIRITNPDTHPAQALELWRSASFVVFDCPPDTSIQWPAQTQDFFFDIFSLLSHEKNVKSRAFAHFLFQNVTTERVSKLMTDLECKKLSVFINPQYEWLIMFLSCNLKQYSTNCARLNHPRGEGCKPHANKACTYTHNCYLCDRHGHGVFQETEDGFTCPSRECIAQEFERFGLGEYASRSLSALSDAVKWLCELRDRNPALRTRPIADLLSLALDGKNN